MITPLKALWRWLVTTPGQQSATCSKSFQPSATSLRCATSQRSHVIRTQPVNTSHSMAMARRPLRMVRVMEAGQTSAQTGRMVISGRMADVCAELDRLAAHEARLH
jgi:hypothetical protein